MIKSLSIYLNKWYVLIGILVIALGLISVTFDLNQFKSVSIKEAEKLVLFYSTTNFQGFLLIIYAIGFCKEINSRLLVTQVVSFGKMHFVLGRLVLALAILLMCLLFYFGLETIARSQISSSINLLQIKYIWPLFINIVLEMMFYSSLCLLIKNPIWVIFIRLSLGVLDYVILRMVFHVHSEISFFVGYRYLRIAEPSQFNIYFFIVLFVTCFITIAWFLRNKRKMLF